MKTAIEAAGDAWKDAPAHVKIMAGAYVSPLLAALADLQRQIDAMNVNSEAFQTGKLIGLENQEFALDMLASAVAEKLMNGAKNGES